MYACAREGPYKIPCAIDTRKAREAGVFDVRSRRSTKSFAFVLCLRITSAFLPFSDQLLGGDALKALVVEFAAQQAEHGPRFVGLLFELRLAHALPKLIFRFDHV